MKKQNFAKVYFGIIGIVTLFFGFMDLIATIGGGEGLSWSILEIPTDGFRGGWGGFIIISSGLFYLFGIRKFSEIHQSANVVMGSILIWIIAGTDIFARIAESIPGGEDGPWFNSFTDFLETYAPPYTPAILLLPFSLVIIFYMVKRRRVRE